MDEVNFLETLLDFLRERGVSFCDIGGQGVSADVEPLVSLDLGLAVAVESIESLEGGPDCSLSGQALWATDGR